MTDHFLVRHYDPPVYGDRPEPWRLYFTCGGCGEELWDEEEGHGGTPGTPEDALEEHEADLEEDRDAPDTLRHCDLPSCSLEPDDQEDR